MTLTLDQIRSKGLKALRRELGPAGMIRFLQHFDAGTGNYAIDRSKWVNATSFDDIRKAAGRKRKKKA